MQKKWIVSIGLACLVVVLAGGYFLFWGDEDKKIINRNLAHLVELAEKRGEESPIVLFGDSGKMLRYIALEPEVEVGPPLPILTDRQELRGVIAQVRQSLQTLSIRIVRNKLTVAEDGQSAHMELEAEATASYAGEDGRERRKFSIGWIKEEGEWVIQKVRLEEIEGGLRGEW